MSEASSKFSSLKRQFERLIDEASMQSVSREVDQLASKVKTLPGEIEEVRGRGYAFRSYLENKADVLQEHWSDIRRRVQRAIDREVEELREDVDEAETMVERGERVEDDEERLEGIVDRIEGVVDRLEARVDAASRRLRGMYETLKSDTDDTERQLSQIKWVCDMKDEASFEFLAGESVFLAAEAEWAQSGNKKEDPDGILFLTDQRLVFEQKEKVGKRFGFFGGKDVQELELDVPLHQIEKVDSENKGFFGGRDMLYFTMREGPHSTLTIELKGSADNDFWLKQINRMATGEVDDERAIPADPELIEKLRNAPTQCHVCGATLPMITAGQMQVECEYCGSVIRL